ncbi:MAG TPA: hypothetical protein VF789_05965 [Thermoanaerobaculia bacterium]
MCALPLLAAPVLAQAFVDDDSTGAASVISEAARGGNGNGNGGGNGHGNGGGNGGGNNGGNNGGNGGGNGGGRGGELVLSVKPATWNTNWVHAAGNLQAFVRGKDVPKIETDSVELAVEGGDSLAPRSVRVAGGQLVATFSKSEAFELLQDPKSGEKETVILRFTVGGEGGGEKELTADVRIVGPDPGEGEGGGEGEGESDLRLNIQPDDWNTNYARSSGVIHAFIRGEGLADIDLDSVRLIGDDEEAEPVKPSDVRRVGNQVVARFPKRAAYDSLKDPKSGETHTVKITFKQDGADKELSEDIKIVGPNR